MPTSFVSLEHPLIESLGWALLHFLWQGLATVLLLALAMRMLRRASSQARYVVLCGAMAVAAICPIATWYRIVASRPVRSETTAVAAGRLETDADSAPSAGSTLAFDSVSVDEETAGGGTGVRPIRVERVQNAEFVPDDDSSSTASAVPVTHSWRERIHRGVEPALSWLVCGWLVGVVVSSVRLLAGWRSIRRIRRLSTTPAPDHWCERMERLALRLGVRRTVRLIESALVEVPTVIGWLRPMILVPGSALTGLAPAQLEAILAHELAHIRRHDYFVNLIQTAIETLLFYHPAVWWISRRIREERENCCDDLAVDACGDTITYARALATMEELRSPPALTLAADGGSLLKRIRRLLIRESIADVRAARRHAPSGVVVVLGFAAACVVVALFVHSQRRLEAASSEEKSASTETAAEKSRDSKSGDPLVVEFPDRTSIELLGVAYGGAPSREGWRPDGRPFETAPDWPVGPGRESVPEDGRKPEVRDFVLRFKGIGTRHIAWRFPGLPTVRNPGRDEVATVRASVGRLGGEEPITFRVGISEAEWGPFQQVDMQGAVTKADVLPRFCREEYDQVRPESPEPRVDSTVFRWRGLRSLDDRVEAEVVAIDTSGQRHRHSGATAWGDEPFRADVFSIPSKKIDHFDYRLRPWRHWVTFENVSLKPGLKTEAKVRSVSRRHIARLTEGVSFELVGVTRGAADASEGWTADGRPLGDVGEWPKGSVISRKDGSTTIGDSGAPDPESRDLLVEFVGLTEIPSMVFSSFDGARGWHHLPLKKVPYRNRLSLLLNKPSKSLNLRIGLATEPWGRWLSIGPDGKPLDPLKEGEAYRADYESIRVERVGKAENDDKKTEITLRRPAGNHESFDFRMKAFDTDGKERFTIRRQESFNAGRAESEATWETDLPLERLARFEYQVRPYRHWVTFENVSLDPERKTDVRGSVKTLSLADSSRRVLTTSKARARAIALGDELAAKVERTVEESMAFLVRRQNEDGSWSMETVESFRVGISSLAVSALLHNGMPVTAEPVRKGLEYLRSVQDPEPRQTYDLALLISALTAAKDETRDMRRVIELTKRLERSRLESGSWSYAAEGAGTLPTPGDHSNGQYAVLALHDAAAFGVDVPAEAWKSIRKHWVEAQNADGGWNYAGGTNASTGSMTTTGLSVLAITEAVLRGEAKVPWDETPRKKAVAWMGENFSVTRNPGAQRTWLMYYLHSLARAGELCGERRFGEHDWYREGAAQLIATQKNGVWQGDSSIEKDPILATSYALSFLARGPVDESKEPTSGQTPDTGPKRDPAK